MVSTAPWKLIVKWRLQWALAILHHTCSWRYSLHVMLMLARMYSDWMLCLACQIWYIMWTIFLHFRLYCIILCKCPTSSLILTVGCWVLCVTARHTKSLHNYIWLYCSSCVYSSDHPDMIQVQHHSADLHAIVHPVSCTEIGCISPWLSTLGCLQLKSKIQKCVHLQKVSSWIATCNFASTNFQLLDPYIMKLKLTLYN